MFIGEHSYSLDDKGRLSMPTRFRETLAKGVVITRGLDGCLFVYPAVAWHELAAKIGALPLSHTNGRAFARLMLAGAWQVELDRQGRISVPEHLRQFANLSKHVVVAGVFDRLEIWDEDLWNQYRTDTEADTSSITDTLAELGV